MRSHIRSTVPEKEIHLKNGQLTKLLVLPPPLFLGPGKSLLGQARNLDI